MLDFRRPRKSQPNTPEVLLNIQVVYRGSKGPLNLMPPQTPKEHLREKQIAGRVAQMAVEAIKPKSSGPTPMAQQYGAASMHIPGASMHPICYTNGDNAEEPDRVVIPPHGTAAGANFNEVMAKKYAGDVPAHPMHERLDNYGNRWLTGEFEYPPYEGKTMGEKNGQDAGESESAAGESEHLSGPQAPRGPGGDEASDYTLLSEIHGEPHHYDGPDQTAAFTGISGHTGSRSDKWPATGNLFLKHDTPNAPGNTNSGAGV